MKGCAISDEEGAIMMKWCVISDEEGAIMMKWCVISEKGCTISEEQVISQC